MPVVDACEASSAIGMATVRPGKLRQAVGEVAERGAACNRDQAERGYGDAGAGVQAVQQQNQRDDGLAGGSQPCSTTRYYRYAISGPSGLLGSRILQTARLGGSFAFQPAEPSNL